MRWPAAIGLSESQQFLFGLWLRDDFNLSQTAWSFHTAKLFRRCRRFVTSVARNLLQHTKHARHLVQSNCETEARSLRDPFCGKRAPQRFSQRIWIGRCDKKPIHTSCTISGTPPTREQRRANRKPWLRGRLGQAFIQTRQAQYVGGNSSTRGFFVRSSFNASTGSNLFRPLPTKTTSRLAFDRQPTPTRCPLQAADCQRKDAATVRIDPQPVTDIGAVKRRNFSRSIPL